MNYPKISPVKLVPTHQDWVVLHKLANAAAYAGNLTKAIDLFRQAIVLRPGVAVLHSNLAAALLRQGSRQEGLLQLEKALELDPTLSNAWANKGVFLKQSGDLKAAETCLRRAVKLNSAHTNAAYELARVLSSQGKDEEALEAYNSLLQHWPDHVDALLNSADTMRKLGHFQMALEQQHKAIAVKPDYPRAHNNEGVILGKLGRHAQAIESYDQAIALNPEYKMALVNRSNARMTLAHWATAAEDAMRVQALDPSYRYNAGFAHYMQLHICDWADYTQKIVLIEKAVANYEQVSFPFGMLAISGDPALQRQCAGIYMQDKFPQPANGTPALPARRAARRIRLAYFSADFHDHATAYLMAGLFECHDRKRFDLIAISNGPSKSSPMQTRLRNAFDQFVDVRGKTDSDVVKLIRSMEIDVAVDLKGFTTEGCSMGIFTQRCAPVQVSYLGYPGTIGVPGWDYLLADEKVIPPEDLAHYSEKVVYLPHSYQVNDGKRVIAEQVPSRTELGLPDEGFVFCCFNNNYQLNPPVFDIWMRLLQKVPSSVLWLLGGSDEAIINLRKEAAARGAAPKRLVFAAWMPQAQHLARLKVADLFLDTLPCNAHTTTSDALWAGLPVLTCMGKSFAGRVAASLLGAAGLPELITRTDEEYEALALTLATKPAHLKALREKLESQRLNCPLFDTDRFRQHIEAAYLSMHDRARSGMPPEAFRVLPGGKTEKLEHCPTLEVCEKAKA